MSFYRILCLILAAFVLFGRFTFPLKRYPAKATLKMFPLKRPAWVDIITLIMFVLALLAWQRALSGSEPNAMIITVVVSLAFVKMVSWMFFYASLRKLALWLYGGGKRMIALNIASLTGFAALILAAFLLY